MSSKLVGMTIDVEGCQSAMTSIVRVTGEQVLPARDLEEYWLYWAEFPGKRAAAMLLPCRRLASRRGPDWVW